VDDDVVVAVAALGVVGHLVRVERRRDLSARGYERSVRSLDLRLGPWRTSELLA